MMTTKDITLIGVLVALLVASQLAFSMVMGINLVFPLLIIFTYNLGFSKSFIIMMVFSIIEFFIWGYIITTALWMWTFTVLILGAYIVSRFTKNEYVAAAYTAFYFVLFGLLCSIQEWVLTDVDFYIYWGRSIPSDFLGAIAGFGTTAVLLNPLSKVIQNYLKSRSNGLTN